ncbi:MAG TPA: hypothetical protein PLV92_07655 [Pirellulaceae bacterium]|nr:hypothetical protein [Pirellulaceae bacterium]
MNRVAAIDILVRAQKEPFKRGTQDCFALAAEVVEAVTGRRPPWANMVGCYRTIPQAFALLAAHGFADLGEGLACHYSEIAPGAALLGDLGVPPGELAREMILIFDGQDWVSRSINGGLYRASPAAVARAFRVA